MTDAVAARWAVERVVSFDPQRPWRDGYAHLGFHDRHGRSYVLAYYQDFVALIGAGDQLEWTVAGETVDDDVPNIAAEVRSPHYLEQAPDGRLLLSSHGNDRIYAVDAERRSAHVLIDGPAVGARDLGNCVIDDSGSIWVNEIEGCRVWRFNADGVPSLVLGNGTPGFQRDEVGFDSVRFNWIYDLRKGPDGRIYVLDSRNYAVRVIDSARQTVTTIAGTGKGGYSGDGGPARDATFGTTPGDRFDGPYALSLDEAGNLFVGDSHNQVVRMIDARTGTITTIAGGHRAAASEHTGLDANPLALDLPLISSMEYWAGKLLVPTWDAATGDIQLAILVTTSAATAAETMGP